MTDDGLSPEQREVMNRVLAEEEKKRRHLVVALSGAHAYGFPSPDSDVDIKAVHIEPTRSVLGLLPAAPHADRMEVIDGVEIDYTSNELKPVLVGVIGGNGNYIERFLGPYKPLAAPAVNEVIPLVKRTLSRRLHRHYLGFATSQLKAFEKDPPGTAKKLLYVLRTALTGTHALLTGEVVTDLRALARPYGFPEAEELIEKKRAGERSKLDLETHERFLGEAKRAIRLLVDADARAVLPLEPEAATEADLEAWLIEARIKRLT